jgi:hypothetical protein
MGAVHVTSIGIGRTARSTLAPAMRSVEGALVRRHGNVQRASRMRCWTIMRFASATITGPDRRVGCTRVAVMNVEQAVRVQARMTVWSVLVTLDTRTDVVSVCRTGRVGIARCTQELVLESAEALASVQQKSTVPPAQSMPIAILWASVNANTRGKGTVVRFGQGSVAHAVLAVAALAVRSALPVIHTHV